MACTALLYCPVTHLKVNCDTTLTLKIKISMLTIANNNTYDCVVAAFATKRNSEEKGHQHLTMRYNLPVQGVTIQLALTLPSLLIRPTNCRLLMFFGETQLDSALKTFSSHWCPVHFSSSILPSSILPLSILLSFCCFVSFLICLHQSCLHQSAP